MPESASSSLEICNLPLCTFIRSLFQAPVDRFQVIAGIGSPDAEQFKDRSSPGSFMTFWGGLVINFGTDMTTNVVTADASPKSFFA